MRVPGRWMKAPDPYILEYLSEEGLCSPSDIANDGRIPFGRTYINKRLKALAENGFVVHEGNGMYRVTSRGEEWLSGEFDARTLDEDDAGKAIA